MSVNSSKDAARYDVGFDSFLDTISPVWEVQRKGCDKDLLYHDGQLRAAYEAGVRSALSEIERTNEAPKDTPSYERCYEASLYALGRLDSVRWMWNGPIHQAVNRLREATGPQTDAATQDVAPMKEGK